MTIQTRYVRLLSAHDALLAAAMVEAENNALQFRQQINRPADFGLWLKSAGLLLDTSGKRHKADISS
jgi:hypothetical protein